MVEADDADAYSGRTAMTYRQPNQINTPTVSRYPSDLIDAEWAIIEPLLPARISIWPQANS
jgi:hypothetical protein